MTIRELENSTVGLSVTTIIEEEMNSKEFAGETISVLSRMAGIKDTNPYLSRKNISRITGDCLGQGRFVFSDTSKQ